MANYSTNEFKGGLKIMLDGEPCSILENEMVKPGKGQAFNRVRIRKLITGKVLEKTFKSGESVEGADVMDTDLAYLYTDGEFWHFMNNETFEQLTITEELIGDQSVYLQDGMQVSIESYEERPIGVSLPDSVTLEVVETEPVVKGQTASSSYKPAIVDNGVRVMVPPHIDPGTRIVVKTEDGTYVERAKD